MLGLEATGFLNSDMGRGFLVQPISGEEFRQSQNMLSKMAPYALGMASPVPSMQIMELNNLLGRARIRVSQPGPDQGKVVVDLVYRWGTILISGCANAMLVADITRLEALSRRCWLEAVILGFDPVPMLSSYDELYELLRTAHPAEAVVHWENHIAQFSATAAAHLPEPSLDI